MHRIRRTAAGRAARAKVAELVDALDLGSSGETRESSSLSFRTRFLVKSVVWDSPVIEESRRAQDRIDASSVIRDRRPHAAAGGGRPGHGSSARGTAAPEAPVPHRTSEGFPPG